MASPAGPVFAVQALDARRGEPRGQQRTLDRVGGLAREEHFLDGSSTSGLKKLASVVRAGGMGRYICVENNSLPAVQPRGKVQSCTSPFSSSIVQSRPSACS